MAAPDLNTARVLHTAIACRELYVGDETEAGGGKFGWGVTPIDAASKVAFTQTYSVASATVADATYSAPATPTTALTDNGGGAAADGTIGAITLTEPANLAAQTVINNQLADAVKELSTKINLLRLDIINTNAALAAVAADRLATAQNVNALIDQQQGLGFAT